MMTGLRNALGERLGVDVPLVQAPIGSAARPELAAAVSAAGALGMLALTWHGPDQARDRIREVRRRTHRPFGANLVLDFPVDDILAVCLREAVPVVSTFSGDPELVSRRIRDAGALHMHTVGSVPEALHAADCGVDVIVAQGWEAGGHIRGSTTTMVLGAQGVWLGTRFLATPQAFAHRWYQDQLVAAGAEDTVHTRCFDDGWPDAPHRTLRNTTVQRWESAGSPPAPDRPGEGNVVAVDDNGRPHHRYEDLIPLPGMTGDLAAMALYAGQSVELVRDIRPAELLVRDLTAQAIHVIERTGRINRPTEAPAEP